MKSLACTIAVSFVIALCTGPATATELGQSWTQATSSAPWSPRSSHEMISHDGFLWLIAGSFNNDVWRSSNGLEWSLVTDDAPWAGRRDPGFVSHNGKLWVLGGWLSDGGKLGDVWSSSDGVDWTLENAQAFPPRARVYAVVHHGRLWVVGGGQGLDGNHNDVWVTDDGANWSEVIRSAPWIPRWGQEVQVHDDKIWLLGGAETPGRKFNDVWWTENGEEWFEMPLAPWTRRAGHAAVVLDGKIWIFGGDSETFTRQNDIWSTVNGQQWHLVNDSPEWSARRVLSAAVHQDKIWVTGGQDAAGRELNDVWFSEREAVEPEGEGDTEGEAPRGPRALSINPFLFGPTNLDSIPFLVRFSENVAGFDAASDLIVNHSGTSNESVDIFGGPEIFTLYVTGLSGDGSFTLEVNTLGDIYNDAGETIVASAISHPVAIDRVAPTLLTTTDSPLYVNAPILVTIRASEPIENLSIFQLRTENLLLSDFSGGESEFFARLVPLEEGIFRFHVDGQFHDRVGNRGADSNIVERIYDVTPPAIHDVQVSPNWIQAGNVIRVTFRTSEPLSVAEVFSRGPAKGADDLKSLHAFEIESDPATTPGPAPLTIHAMDLAGNIGTFHSPSAFVILPQDAQLPALSWPVMVIASLAGLILFALRRMRRYS